MIKDFNWIVEDLDKPFLWCKSMISLDKYETQIDKLNKWTAMVFGECGQGKSSLLNEIVDIMASKYYKIENHGCTFKSMESSKAVTSCV